MVHLFFTLSAYYVFCGYRSTHCLSYPARCFPEIQKEQSRWYKRHFHLEWRDNMTQENFRRLAGMKALTDGHSGPVFAVAIYEIDTTKGEVSRHVWRLPDHFVKDEATRQKYLPRMQGTPTTHYNYDNMMQSIADWINLEYAPRKAETELVVDTGIVEGALLRELAHRGLVNFNQEISPVYNTATLLRVLGRDPNNVKQYLEEVASEHGVRIPDLPEPLNKAAKIALAHACLLTEFQQRLSRVRGGMATASR